MSLYEKFLAHTHFKPGATESGTAEQIHKNT